MNNNYVILKKTHIKLYYKLKKIDIDKDTYEICTTKQGMYTLKVKLLEILYLHSKYNPIREAKEFVEENYNKKINNYIVTDIGFGYHINELLKKDNIFIHLIICNLQIFKIALENIDLTEILKNPKIKIYIGDSINNFKKSFIEATKSSDYKLILHNPSIKSFPENMKEIKYLLEEFKVKDITIKNNYYDLDDNFNYNIAEYDEVVNNLFNKFEEKSIFLVAAGPSLDKNKILLKNIDSESIIISMGRSVKVLLKEGIIPNYIIITDPSDYLYDLQLKGLDIDVPIIILSTCDKAVMKNYKGKKYIALQEGYKKSENYAKKLNIKTVQTGGSVATTSLDVSIKMGGNPIIFVGQDLAYSQGQTHSVFTNSKDIKGISSMRKIKDITGKEVYTSKNLSIYLRWIENRIRKEENIEFIDATEGGARIIGTDIMCLKDVINKYCIKG